MDVLRKKTSVDLPNTSSHTTSHIEIQATILDNYFHLLTVNSHLVCFGSYEKYLKDFELSFVNCHVL